MMELSGLDGKTALITGASRGIGRAIAEILAESGIKVICSARDMSLLTEICVGIEGAGGVAVPVRADVSLTEDRQQLVDRAISTFDGVDFLINNAGVHGDTATLELTDEELRHVLEINFVSMFSLSRDLGRHMMTRGGGKIINMGSFWGQLGVRKHVAYCVTKAAIEAMTRCLAVEWAQHNIQVNTVAPGHIMTDIAKAAMEDEKLRGEILRRIPARRIGEPEEVAYLVAFLCSQESNYITGHIYYLDGGQQIAW
jgi:NAD(P)-dependent dehydrogenase (short-subunit alcohol dehydrogenase family)